MGLIPEYSKLVDEISRQPTPPAISINENMSPQKLDAEIDALVAQELGPPNRGEVRYKGSDVAVGCGIMTVALFGLFFCMMLTLMPAILAEYPEIYESPTPLSIAETQEIVEPFLVENFPQILLYMAILYPFALLAGVAYIAVRIKRDWTQIGLYPIDRSRLRYAFQSGFIAAIFITGGDIAAASMSGNLSAYRASILDLLNNSPSLLMMIGLLTGILILPFAEELFFRGVLYTWMRRVVPMFWATLICGLLFGIMAPFPLNNLPGIFVGIGLCMIYERSGSLWTAYFAHSTFNFFSIMLYLAIVILT